MSENNDNSNDSNSRTDSILQASRLNNPIRAGVLRPSVLGSSLNSSNNSDGKAKDGENDSESLNPFLRESKDDDDDGQEAGASSENNKRDESDDDEKDDRPDPLNLLAKNGFERASLFAAAKSSMPRVERSGFVFGQNVHERVTGENIHAESSTSKSDNSTASADSPLLFSSVIQAAAKPENEGAAKESTDAKSLTEVAREYEESRAQKRKFEEVETFTGEEDEANIVDISCKLFAFVNSNWEERGRGSLRLNDSKVQECSRVVFRTSGNLRLLVNTKVWAGMVAERPSQKSMRLTAMDNNGQIKVFLVMARPAEISNLHKLLVKRIEKIKLLHPIATVDCDDSNDGKNGSADKCEVAAAAAVPAPSESAHADADGESEPSPKKPLVATAAAAAESD
ncbi:ran-binding protein 3 [Episyrphus balteatus]|uniref:ran-binding protein 3 n=1 Tax=Episyrphus balteatus TaxID=286459 RepID=UPI00248683F4|nr:ran-binding protein 3 [Episyrphus balteatus]